MARRAHITVTIKRNEHDERNEGMEKQSYHSNDIDRKLRQLKKKIERERIFHDAKRQVYFEPQSQKRRKRYLRAVKVEAMRLAMSHTGGSANSGVRSPRSAGRDNQ